MTTVKSQSRELDQFYTKETVAKHCVDVFYEKVGKDFKFMEPSAGTGVFLNLLPVDTLAFDLDPKDPRIQQSDFLLTTPDADVAIGNPPFGKNASLAVKFFNHSSDYVKFIAFIIPRTFRKKSIKNRLNLNFHLIHDETIEDNAFIHNGNEYSVPCVFQIWEKRDTVRVKESVQTSHPDFTIVAKAEADFCIQRVGGRAGLIREADFMTYSEASHYFIKVVSQNVTTVIDTFKSIDFNRVKHETAGNPSISPSELYELYSEKIPVLSNKLFEVNS